MERVLGRDTHFVCNVIAAGVELQIVIIRSVGVREDQCAVGHTKNDCLVVGSKVRSCTQPTGVATSDLRIVSLKRT